MKGLIDSTLREGGQMVGLNFRPEEKLAIIRGLDRIGIEEIEIGVATAYDRDLPELLRRLSAKFRISLGVHCHNDFGMASANTVTALESGAEWADVTI